MYEKDIETMSLENIENYQFEQLKKMLQRIYDKVPFYREKMKEHNISGLPVIDKNHKVIGSITTAHISNLYEK